MCREQECNSRPPPRRESSKVICFVRHDPSPLFGPYWSPSRYHNSMPIAKSVLSINGKIFNSLLYNDLLLWYCNFRHTNIQI